MKRLTYGFLMYGHTAYFYQVRADIETLFISCLNFSPFLIPHTAFPRQALFLA